ncbi:MAG: S-layer homology domain-containing protein [Candidatus Peregrinibacteria bacterium]
MHQWLCQKQRGYKKWHQNRWHPYVHLGIVLAFVALMTAISFWPSSQKAKANTLPSSTTPTFSSQATNGSGYVTFTTQIDDTDDDDVKVKVQYSDDDGMSWYDPDLVSVTASTGTPDLDDAETYQIGTNTAVSTSSGANTLTIVWDTQSATNGNGSLDDNNQLYIKIRITANDSTTDGIPSTSMSFTVDNLDPTAPGNLTLGSRAATSLTVNFGAQTTETNFANYKIFYKAAASGVTTSDTEFDDADLDSITYNSTSDTTITGLSANTQYTANIWAYDDYGNGPTPAAAELTAYTAANTPGIPTVNNATTTTVDVTLDTNSNPSNTTFAIQDVASGNYVQANGSLSGSAVWQNNATWGTVTVTGLSVDTSYTFKVKAKNGNDVETGFGTASSALYTLANAPGTPVVDSAATTTLDVTLDQNSNSSNTTYTIQDVSSGNYVQTNGSLGAGAVWKTYANWGGISGVTVTGLSVNTTYTFKAKAKNGNSTETALSSASTALYTLANVPGAPTVDDIMYTTLDVTIDENSNPSNTTYAIQETGSGNYVQAAGTLGASAVYQTYTVWGGASGVTVTGLTNNTVYTFAVIARNGDSMDSIASSGTTETTLTAGSGRPSSRSTSSSASQTTVSQPTITTVRETPSGETTATTEGAGTETVSDSSTEQTSETTAETETSESGAQTEKGPVTGNVTSEKSSVAQTVKDVISQAVSKLRGSAPTEDGTVRSKVEGLPDETQFFTDVTATYVYAEPVLYFKEKGVVEGYENGRLLPNELLNRAELMKIIVGQAVSGKPDERKYRNCFNDIHQEWFAPYICYAKEQGWVQGFSDGNFGPSGVARRAEIVKMIAVALKLKAPASPTAEKPFPDVSRFAWYAPYVQTVKDLDALKSWKNFEPDAGMKRGVMLEMMYKLLAQ